MIHIYTGSGKGKTTSALGLAMRASGQGLKVIIFQFLKPKTLLSGEEASVKRLKNVKLIKFSQMHPMFGGRHKDLVGAIKKDFEEAKKAILGRRYDMVVLDEIINAVDQDFIGKTSLIRLLEAAPKSVEIVLTGRGDISGFEEYADYITIMTEKKHPFKTHKPARKGIEY